MKEEESNSISDSDLNHDKGNNIIDAKPSDTITTIKIQLEESKENEEGHSSSIHKCG